MENTTKRYWKGLEELKNDTEFVKNSSKEFPGLDEGFEPTHRRDFLKYLGFGMAAVSLAACEAPLRNSISYLNKPEDIEPGIPNWYATTYSSGGDFASILVKTREGRPIKIEGNKSSSITKGGVSAKVHASILGLYDNAKLKGATKGSTAVDWKTLDAEVVAELSKIAAAGGQIRIVSSTTLSPSTKAVIAGFIAKYPTAKHVIYDATSASGLIQANATSFGQAVIPAYDFSKAKTIVAINADFMGSWLSPIEFAAQWAKTRKLSSAKEGGNNEISRHYQFEAGMTNTGASADYRGTMKPSQEGLVALALYNKLTGGAAVSINAATDKIIAKAATDLRASGSASIVVSGSNDANVQTIVNAINANLGTIGTTIDFGHPVNYRQGNDLAMNDFITEAKAGQIAAVIFMDANPVYNHPRSEDVKAGIAKAKLSISLSDRSDETASLCQYIAPNSHYLESWGDAEPKRGSFALMQPTISPIYKTRQLQDSLLAWSGASSDYYSFLKSYWSKNILNGLSWEKAVYAGVLETGSSESSGATFKGDVAAAASAVKAVKSAGLELSIYESVALGNGSEANNPWLLEMPDPVSKVTWENYIAISPKDAKAQGLAQGDWANLTVNGKTIELPVLEQPGQSEGSVSVALGFGREKAGKAANGAGVNAYPLTSVVGGSVVYSASGVTLAKTKDNYTMAQTQTHSTVMARQAVIQESILSEYKKDVKAGRFEPKIPTSDGMKKPYQISLWNGHEKKNHSWGMVIDLNLCNGCNACVVSCNAENNVSTVGKVEVARAREMHWLRIDRYYSSDAAIDDVAGLEIASENPEVVFQPMMCQHCSNAPCETVCPVLATTHSSEGLNQMTYNRCVGTRYCANNCPYKVRRFNWFKYYENENFDYHHNNDLGRMAINPEVTMRSRGVIEKCSMCVQRIQSGKLEAKKERRRLYADEIQTACSQSCPTGAITFGDMNDEASTISKILAVENEGRAFHMLEEINVKPQVSYLTKIRNRDESSDVSKRIAEDLKHGRKKGHDNHAGHEKHDEAAHAADTTKEHGVEAGKEHAKEAAH